MVKCRAKGMEVTRNQQVLIPGLRHRSVRDRSDKYLKVRAARYQKLVKQCEVRL